MFNLQTSQLQPEPYGPILASVFDAVEAAGFAVARLQPDIPNTLNGAYRFETYLLDAANLAFLELSPGVATERNLLIGPSGPDKDRFSFKVHALAGESELLMWDPDIEELQMIALHVGAPVVEVRPSQVYWYRNTGARDFVVVDYCDPAFQQGWEKTVELGSEEWHGLRMLDCFLAGSGPFPSQQAM
jgi:hypothetical protein